MRVSARAFWAAKAGNDSAEYEDSYYPRDEIIGDEHALFRFAVADGATETSYSGIWATQLVRSFCRGRLDRIEPSDPIQHLREGWRRAVSRKPLPWYAEEKVRAGAFAAIAGLLLEDGKDRETRGPWRAVALGDSCIFQLRGKKLLARFPIEKSEQFNNSPVLLSSIRPQSEPDPAIQTYASTWREGDTFYLMTDAIACWFLKEWESGSVPADVLRNLTPDEPGTSFEPWLNTLRLGHSVRNDDVTIVRIEIERT